MPIVPSAHNYTKRSALKRREQTAGVETSCVGRSAATRLVGRAAERKEAITVGTKSIIFLTLPSNLQPWKETSGSVLDSLDRSVDYH
jgi:hypothetical protein